MDENLKKVYQCYLELKKVRMPSLPFLKLDSKLKNEGERLADNFVQAILMHEQEKLDLLNSIKEGKK